MKYVKQFLIILTISLMGELIRKILPLPIPASIYGLLIMLIALQTKVLHVSDVKETSLFLIDIMPIMFIPGAVRLMDIWDILAPLSIPIFIISIISTIFVMVVSAKTTEYIIKRKSTGR